MKWPADRIAVSSPKSFGMYEKAVPLAESGADLIHLEFGRPDFDTPQHIKLATQNALQSGQVHYSDFRGLLELRRAIAARLKTHNNLDFEEEEILVTNGLTHAAFSVFLAAIDPGDEVILLEPYYPQHINKIELAGGKVVCVPLDKENGFALNPSAIENAITDRTRLICIVNPTNPTGRVFKKGELQALAEIAVTNDLLVISDEVYERIVYDDNVHTSIASLPEMRDRTFSLFAFTKAYAMDGWRIGYIAASEKFMPALLKMTMNDVAHVNTFCQYGAVAALNDSQDSIEKMIAEDKRRRDLVWHRLNQMVGVSCHRPEGTIYAFADISATKKTSAMIAETLLICKHVVVESGTFYGKNGEGYLRICFGAETYDRLNEAMDRMERYFSELASPMVLIGFK